MLRKISKNSQLNDILRGSVIAFAVKLLAAGGAFLLNIVIARILGADQAGYFFLAQAIIIILAVCARQGFDNALVRFIAGYGVRDENQHIAGIYTYALIRIIPVLMLLTLSLWFFSAFISEWIFQKPLLSGVLAVGALAVLPVSLSQLHGFCLQGQKRVTSAMLFQSAALAVLALVIIWIIKPIDAVQAMAGYVLAATIVCVISSVVWNKNRTPKFAVLPHGENAAIKDAIKPLFMILLLSQATHWTGQLMLGVFNSTVDVALFSTAQRTAMLTSFILVAVNSIAAPKFAEAYKQDKLHEVKEIAISSSRIMTLITVPVVLFMLIFAEWLMSLFGADFVDGANILRILAVGQFVNVITGSVGYLLQMTGHEKILRNNVVISSFIMIIGGAIAIPLFGIYGAATVTAISIAIQNLLCVYQVKRKLGFNTLNILHNH